MTVFLVNGANNIRVTLNKKQSNEDLETPEVYPTYDEDSLYLFMLWMFLFLIFGCLLAASLILAGKGT
ncbi:MAG TPA: hypothetical protein DCY14_05400 [Anaerolineae bacterium]|nr:hypothetical protein [Anaerolineae bacterium]